MFYSQHNNSQSTLHYLEVFSDRCHSHVDWKVGSNKPGEILRHI